MRAVIYHGPRDIRLEDLPMPAPGPGEVVVKLGAALTCGTDFKAYRQGHRVLLGTYPSAFGHELSGTISALGKGVTTAKEGDRVVVANSAPMDDCFWCTNGQNHLCRKLKLHNGAYADFDLVPAAIARHNLWPIPDALAFEAAALSEPLACALHGVEAARVQAVENAVVVGAGVIYLDPIFQGLAVSLIGGVLVSTALTLVVIPLLYFMYLKTVGTGIVLAKEAE